MRTLFFLFLILLLSLDTAAQAPSARRRGGAVKARVAKKKRSTIWDKYYTLGPRIHIWQEEIGAERMGSTDRIQMQMQSTTFSMTYKKPFRNIRWLQSHSLEAGFGTLKGKGRTTEIPDFLVQPFYLIVASPGIIYRTSPPSELGFSLPLTFRFIEWRLNDESLQLEKAASLGYGITFSYGQRITPLITVLMAFTNQMSPSATTWSLGLDYSLR